MSQSYAFKRFIGETVAAMAREPIENIVEEYGDMIYRLALHYVKNTFDAEDVVQEVLLSFSMRQIPRERQKAWILRVTVNKSLDLLRKRKRENVLTKEPSTPAHNAFSLAEEMECLPPADRELVYLFYFEGYSSKEIASLTGMRDATVRKRLERAKKKLKTILGAQT